MLRIALLFGLAALALPVHAVAQTAGGHHMENHHAMMSGHQMATAPAEPGQAAFAAIQEIAWSVCIATSIEGAAMKYFAGLDVSLEETAICVVDETGTIVGEARARASRRLWSAFREVGAGGGADRPGGMLAVGLAARGPARRGLPAVCIETRQAKAAMKTMPNKTDRNDARALAQIMRTGWYRRCT